jgi:predicted nucleotidyltransferase
MIRMTLIEIISKLAPMIASNPQVHAMWLEGSYATGKQHEGSDIDVWLDVDDGSFEASVSDFREKLARLVNIEKETTRGVYSTNPRLMKQTFILEGFPEGQDIELDLQEHSRQFLFSRKENAIKVLFDKDDTIKWTD